MADTFSEDEQESEELLKLREATAGVEKITNTARFDTGQKKQDEIAKDDFKAGVARYLARLMDKK